MHTAAYWVIFVRSVYYSAWILIIVFIESALLIISVALICILKSAQKDIIS